MKRRRQDEDGGKTVVVKGDKSKTRRRHEEDKKQDPWRPHLGGALPGLAESTGGLHAGVLPQPGGGQPC